LLADVRREQIAERLRSAGSVSVAEIEVDYAISAMTARRDLAELERRGLARRTHGGAVVPTIAAHEDSFASRLLRDEGSKSALGIAAAALVAPGESVYIDSSSTAFHAARALVDRRLEATVLTNSLPVIDLIAADREGQLDLVVLGGPMRRLTQSFVGPRAIAATSAYYADRVLFSVKGITPDGLMTDADSLEAEVKRAMIEHSEERVLLLDRSKLDARGLSVIGPIANVSRVLAHGLRPDETEHLRSRGAQITAVGPNTGVEA